MQFGTLLEKIELLPVELNYFISVGQIASYLPGPGLFLFGKVFSILFSCSKSVLLERLATKLCSRATTFCAFIFGLYNAGPTLS